MKPSLQSCVRPRHKSLPLCLLLTPSCARGWSALPLDTLVRGSVSHRHQHFSKDQQQQLLWTLVLLIQTLLTPIAFLSLIPDNTVQRILIIEKITLDPYWTLKAKDWITWIRMK
jgi:hypothetical protein